MSPFSGDVIDDVVVPESCNLFFITTAPLVALKIKLLSDSIVGTPEPERFKSPSILKSSTVTSPKSGVPSKLPTNVVAVTVPVTFALLAVIGFPKITDVSLTENVLVLLYPRFNLSPSS